MGKFKPNFQDSFLQQMKQNNCAVAIYLVNGFQLRGYVKGFDNFTIFLENEGKVQLVYKHAITTVTPVKPVKINFQMPSEKKIEEEQD